jgi:hypothetical protein
LELLETGFWQKSLPFLNATAIAHAGFLPPESLIYARNRLFLLNGYFFYLYLLYPAYSRSFQKRDAYAASLLRFLFRFWKQIVFHYARIKRNLPPNEGSPKSPKVAEIRQVSSRFRHLQH